MNFIELYFVELTDIYLMWDYWRLITSDYIFRSDQGELEAFSLSHTMDNQTPFRMWTVTIDFNNSDIAFQESL